jgi:GDP-L-fucose synthase
MGRDLRYLDQAQKMVKSVKPDVVIHAAGLVGGILANDNRQLDFLADNVTIGTNVIRAAYDQDVSRVINLGTSCIYPTNSPDPIPEEMLGQGPLEPTNEGYALAKLAVAKLAGYCGFKTLIPCNQFGKYDKFDLENAHLIPAAIAKIHAAKMSGDQTVTIWGDGTARREFMYVADLADLIWRAVDRYDSLPPVMNVGALWDWSVQDYYESIANIIGWKGQFLHDTRMPVGIRRKRVSTKRQSEWGWTPEHSVFEGIRLTYEWFARRT